MSPDSLAYAREYIEAGWSLCAVDPGSKKAAGDGWQTSGRPAEHWRNRPDDGMGLVHGLSGTCAIDLDDMESARIALRAVGIDLDALFAAPGAVRLIGAPGRGKLLYRAPDGLSRRALNWPHPETGKRFAVVELRGGDVMDVLPPSIHPDTGVPYRWEGDWRALPDLPPEVLAAWQHWTDAKRDMESACPWDDRPTASAARYEGVERQRYAEGESVIAAFNEAHSLALILEAFGYRKAGPRYISPHSASGLPGVVMLPGGEGRICYVHHASDPLCDGHAHDAFSVWMHYAHDGDVRRAVKAAAELLGMDHVRTEARDGAEIAARIMGPKVPPPPDRERTVVADPPPAPPDLTIPIPALADLEHWLRLRHHGAKRIATTQGALSFAAAMTARRYVTTERQPTNVLLGIVDTSTAGLRPLKGALYEAADASGERRIIRGTKVSSDAAIHRALLRCPRMYWVIDDYGYMVAMARKQPSGALESALGALQDTYNAYPLYLDPETVGSRKEIPLSDCTIQAPGVVALMLVSEDQMREVTRRAEYGRGAVQQTLFARSDPWPDDDAGRSPGSPVPKSVIEMAKALRRVEQAAVGGLNAMATHPPSPATVELGPGAADAFEEIRAALRVLFQDDELARWRGISHGAFATVRRLSAALGAWADPEVPIVTADLVRWVGAWVVHHVGRSVEWYDAIASDDGEPDLVSDIRSVLYAAGPDGVTSRELARRCRSYRKLSLEKRQETIEQMMDDRLCVILAAGRTQKYVDRAYIAVVPEPSNA